VLGGTTNVAEQTRALEALAARLRAAGAVEAAPIRALPAAFRAAELPASVGGEPALGLADDTLAPIGFEPVGTFAITGPPQSGKTTAMRAVIDAVRRHDPEVRLFHLAGRRPALTDHAEWMRSATSVDEVKSLARELAEVIADPTVPGRYLIAVENVTQFADSDAERPLKELFQAVNRSEHFLVGDADVANLSSGFGFVGDFKAGRRGVALRPDAYDGDSVFKTPFPKVKRSDFPEGRGFFVQDGRVALVQLPQVG
jgi:S-DNA-T family DNA segregation ATPase FtsK/SpoIIIE